MAAAAAAAEPAGLAVKSGRTKWAERLLDLHPPKDVALYSMRIDGIMDFHDAAGIRENHERGRIRIWTGARTWRETRCGVNGKGNT